MLNRYHLRHYLPDLAGSEAFDSFGKLMKGIVELPLTVDMNVDESLTRTSSNFPWFLSMNTPMLFPAPDTILYQHLLRRGFQDTRDSL